MYNILKPEVMWIEGRCYRVNDSQPDMNFFQERDLYENDDVYLEDEGDDDTNVTVTDNGRFYLSLHVSKHYHGAIIGKKGGVRMRIERDTRTDIKIPRPGENKDILIYGSSAANVKAAKRKIEMIVMSSRKKQRPTHFISIPMNHQSIIANFETFKQEVVRTCKGIDESLFIRGGKLHVTIGVMCLMDNEERTLATSLLNDAVETVVMPRLRDHMPFSIRVRGLSYMNDEPRATHVLYARVEDVDAPPGTLQAAVDELFEHFHRAGLMKREFDRDSVKMHVTLMNSKYRSVSQGAEGDLDGNARREPFDASDVLSKYSNYDFGVMELNEVHLSQRKTTAADGFYQSTCVVALC